MPVVTLTAATVEGIKVQAAQCRALWATVSDRRLFLELRLDLLEDPAAGPALVETLGLGVLVTARLRKDGGSGRLLDDERRAELLSEACRAGAEWVDVEWDSRHLDPANMKAKVVLSIHDFVGDRTRVEQAIEGMHSMGGSFVKVATTSQTFSDLAWVLDLAKELGEQGTCFAMGEAGRLSRWHRLVVHGCDDWIYCSGGRVPAAPGQPTLGEIVQHAPRFWGRPKGEGRFLALLGNPTCHSLSPRSFNAVLAKRRVPALYVTLPSDDLNGLVPLLGRVPVKGLSVTAPHKVAALVVAGGCSDRATQAGAANTLVPTTEGDLEAYNTDVLGVLNPLTSALHSRGLSSVGRALVVGAGGAARAGVVALTSLAQEVFVTSRRPGPGEVLASELGVSFISMPDAADGGFGVVVNATPAGGPTQLGQRPVPASCTQGAVACLDMNYRPSMTPFLSDAIAGGAIAVPGLEMFCEQAKQQWSLFLPNEEDGDVALQLAIEMEALGRRPDLVLIGGRGSGKTTAGQLLAESSGRPFIDMDVQLESAFKMSISEFFARQGEEEFRRRESECALSLAENPTGGRIIATGGGAILTEEARNALQACGCVVFLDVDALVAHERIQQGSSPARPALTSLDSLAEMELIQDQRRPLYLGAADVVMDANVDAPSVSKALRVILNGQSLLLQT